MDKDNWIKITDQEPPVGEELLFFAMVKHVHPPELIFAGKIWQEGGNIGVIGCGGRENENDFWDSEVTHWQPLPKPPIN